jgi:threonine dehydrogenase-like Zn-dependent dehydrogenase
MKAVALPAQGRIEVVDIAMPTIQPYECLVKVLACGFCNSTDLKTIDDHLGGPVPFPVILGHEGVGEVVEVGSQVRNWLLGDRMTNPSGRLAEDCGYRRHWGGMVEYAVVQDREVMEELGLPASAFVCRATRKIPRDLSPIDGGVLLTLAEACSALDNFGFVPGMDVLVYGDGPVGLALCTFLRMRGAGWIGCIGHHQDRLDRIAQAGADFVLNSAEHGVDALGDRKVDLVIDAVGSTAIIVEGAARLRQRGKVGVYGVIPRDDSQLDLLALPNNVGVHNLCYPHGELDTIATIVELATDGRLDLASFYSHVVPVDDIARGVELIRSRAALKVIVEF